MHTDELLDTITHVPYIDLKLTNIRTLLTRSVFGRLSDWTSLAHRYVKRGEVDGSRDHRLSVIQVSYHMLLTNLQSSPYTIHPFSNTAAPRGRPTTNLLMVQARCFRLCRRIKFSTSTSASNATYL